MGLLIQTNGFTDAGAAEGPQLGFGRLGRQRRAEELVDFFPFHCGLPAGIELAQQSHNA